MKNVCIVGYGAIAPTHAKALESVENARLYAVCDIKEEAIKRCQTTYENVIGYLDFDEMLQDAQIDTVHICTPHYLHYPMIQRALKAGKDVVSEKPLTITRMEYEKLIELEGVEGVCAIIQNRYNPCVVRLKELIEQKELGDILAIKAWVTWNRDSKYYGRADWLGKWTTEGGSALINQALHTLDLMIYLAGNVESLQASMHNYRLQGIIETEDTVEAYLRFEDGFTGLFYAANTYAVDSDPEIEIAGTKGIARYAYKKLLLNGELIAEDALATNGKAYWGNGHTALLKNYYDKGQYFSATDIKNTMYTLYGIYDSAKHDNRIVKLSAE